jgi:hypothetical protein
MHHPRLEPRKKSLKLLGPRIDFTIANMVSKSRAKAGKDEANISSVSTAMRDCTVISSFVVRGLFFMEAVKLRDAKLTSYKMLVFSIRGVTWSPFLPFATWSPVTTASC